MWLIDDPIFVAELERSRAKLLASVAEGEFTFFRTYGNIGDRLINAGARQLFAGMKYTERDIREGCSCTGDLAVVCGGGGWCSEWHDMPQLVRSIENRFTRVIVFPSSFDPRNPDVLSWLKATHCQLFVRERVSFDAISAFCNPILALDTAFFFDYKPWTYDLRHPSILLSYRTDIEKRIRFLPEGNQDISIIASDFDHWLHSIARHSTIWTDRAHVMIAAAMMGKSVLYCESKYHKLRGIAEYALGDYVDYWDPDEVSFNQSQNEDVYGK